MSFQVYITVSHKKYTRERTGHSFKCVIDKTDLKKRIKFLMNLVCESHTHVGVRFCDAAEIQSLNLSYRGKNKPTDVLSFPCFDAHFLEGGSGVHEDGEHRVYLGDIIICVPVCVAQTKRHRVTSAFEFEKMIIHGLVHLKGLDHERSDAAWRVMTSLEKSLHRELILTSNKPQWVNIDDE